MSGLFVLLWLAANIVMIVFIIKTVKEKDVEAKKAKRKIWLISLAAAFVFLILVGVTGGSSDSSDSNETTEEDNKAVEQIESEANTGKIEEATPEPEEQSKEFEVTMNVNARKEGNGVLFDIDTNLPDEAVLMLTLSNGDYNTDDSFTAQTKVTINDK